MHSYTYVCRTPRGYTTEPRPSGGWDLGGKFVPDYSFMGVPYDLHTTTGTSLYAYNPGNYYSSYPLEYDDSARYASLQAYEEQLRLMRDISEEERIARWRARLAFEELEQEERVRYWERMAEQERMRLGLIGAHTTHYRRGGSLSPWASHRLPLSSFLSSHFSRLHSGGGIDDRHVRTSIAHDLDDLRALADADRLRYAEQLATVRGRPTLAITDGRYPVDRHDLRSRRHQSLPGGARRPLMSRIV